MQLWSIGTPALLQGALHPDGWLLPGTPNPIGNRLLVKISVTLFIVNNTCVFLLCVCSRGLPLHVLKFVFVQYITGLGAMQFWQNKWEDCVNTA